MKFFIDTAEVAEIRAAHELGLVDGVTTNPSLIAKSGRDFREVDHRDHRHRRRPDLRRGDRHSTPRG